MLLDNSGALLSESISQQAEVLKGDTVLENNSSKETSFARTSQDKIGVLQGGPFAPVPALFGPR